MRSDAPPAATTRRRRRWALGLAVAAALAAGLVAWPRSPDYDPTPVRRAARRVASVYQSLQLPPPGALQDALGRAEAASRRATGPARRPPRDPESLEEIWRSVEEASALAHASRREARRRAAERWPAVEGTATGALRRARAEILDPGLRRGQQAARLALAASRLELGRRLAVRGRFEPAVAAAEETLAEADAIHRDWLAAHARFADPAELEVWRRWVEISLREARASGERLLIVDKLSRALRVYSGYRTLSEFAVELGSNGLERKLFAGDRATPEGRYRVVERRGPGRTRYHLALLLDYPNADDLSRWRTASRSGGVPPGRGPGGLIEIHGMGGQGRDWTDGCVALSNPDMERLFELVAPGTAVTIVGSLEGFDARI